MAASADDGRKLASGAGGGIAARAGAHDAESLETLDDRALIAAVLGSRQAARVAATDVADLLDATPARLLRLGLGQAARRRLLAAAELARRFQPAPRARPAITTPEAALPYLAALRGARTEILAVLPLDVRLAPLSDLATVAVGAVSHVSALPREVFAPALDRRAAAIVLAHNHPSGAPDPSPEDVRFTHLMGRAGRLLGVPVIDHLVVARRGYFSFRAAGLLEAAS